VTAAAAAPRIPVVDLARRAAALEPELSAAVDRVIRSGCYLFGPELDAFESELVTATGRAHAIGVSSGTDALRLALVALGIGPGDEVIVPALTAVPTAAAVAAVGAVPVFADVDARTATIDPVSARAVTTEHTRAVIPVHLYGRPAALPDLGIPVVEDGAQAFGALDAESGSAAVAYSFYPTKNLGGITDGGAVVTDDADTAVTLRLLRAHGHAGDYVHTLISTNARLSDVAAAALRVGLPRVDADNRRRREIAAAYRGAAPHLDWQDEHPRHVYHLCVARVPNRGELRRRLPFDTAVHYPKALTQQPAYARFVRTPCPEAERWASECVSFPCFPEMTDDEIEAVCRAIR
jgi:dTDP-3-amino-3,4,6-trideoxy-alpha-D-glucose transaminase